jgi:hypothetical protein
MTTAAPWNSHDESNHPGVWESDGHPGVWGNDCLYAYDDYGNFGLGDYDGGGGSGGRQFVLPHPTSLASKALPEMDGTPALEPDSQYDTMEETYISESEWAEVIDIIERHKGEFYATMLQDQIEEEETDRRRKVQQDEENVMGLTHRGRACVFAERVLAGLAEILGPSRNQKDSESIETAQISAMSKDAMVCFALRLLEKQEEFQKAGKPVIVDLGYHYTEESNIKTIRTGGLMTRTERQNQHIKVDQKNGQYLGNGIYTGNNPIAFTRYGTVGLLVARLQGQSQWIPRKSPIRHQLLADCTIDTVVGNKRHNPFYDEVALAESSQCLPIVEFPTSLITRSLRSTVGTDTMVKIEMKMQQVVDEFFNCKLSYQIEPIWYSEKCI